jgi:hypothetical protein
MKTLFEFPDVQNTNFDIKLTELVKSFDFNEIQQYFIFIKTKFNKTKIKGPENNHLRRIFYYKNIQDTKPEHIDIIPKILDINPFRAFCEIRSNHNHPLRKMKRHQELSIYFGPRLKNHMIKNSFDISNLQNKETNNYFFNISEKYSDQITDPKNLINCSQKFELSHINFLLNKKLLSNYKIPIYLFQSLMCTDQYEAYSENFLNKIFIEQELASFFSKKVFLKVETNNIFKTIFISKSKLKFPWSAIELLNVIPYIRNLEKKINIKYLSDK